MKKLYLALSIMVFSLQSMASGQNDFILGRLKTSDKIVEIWSRNGKPLYVVTDVSGNVLSKKMTRQELSVGHPELYRLVERGISGGASIILAKGELPSIRNSLQSEVLPI